ncbi:hypothetical protein SLH46_07660 [Draconibacterium sp. IB214405]|uniref:hypothetical protein n=1 Tax=Draconibacterium sp. IB214405 TaxID=3097352 RepID=UPI002A12EF8F|nr:hypothetical protein [Draconibacterium sp. IB214405]MDX8339055.1 hypothetical protein [Draconibacterium sp. IB214405]
MKKKKIGIIVTVSLFALILVTTLTSSKAETFHSAEEEEVLQLEDWMIDEQTWKI